MAGIADPPDRGCVSRGETSRSGPRIPMAAELVTRCGWSPTQPLSALIQWLQFYLIRSSAGALAAKIRGGDSVVRLDHDFGRRSPARLRPAFGHRAVSILRRCRGVFPRRRGNFIFCKSGETVAERF